MFLAVHHVHRTATFHSAHFSIAFALPDVQRLLGHILSAYHTDMTNDVFPPSSTVG